MSKGGFYRVLFVDQNNQRLSVVDNFTINLVETDNSFIICLEDFNQSNIVKVATYSDITKAKKVLADITKAYRIGDAIYQFPKET